MKDLDIKFDFREYELKKSDGQRVKFNAFYGPGLYIYNDISNYADIFFNYILENDFSKDNLISNFEDLFKYMLDKLEDKGKIEKIENYITTLHRANNKFLNVNNTKIIRNKILKQFKSSELEPTKIENILNYFIILLNYKYNLLIDEMYIPRIDGIDKYEAKMK